MLGCARSTSVAAGMQPVGVRGLLVAFHLPALRTPCRLPRTRQWRTRAV